VTPDLRVLTGLPRADRWHEVRDAAMSHILDLARRVADVVVVDCGFSLEADEELSYDTVAPRRNATTLTTLEHADPLVVVGAGDPVGLQRLVRGLTELGHVPSPEPLVVVTKVRSSAAGPHPGAAIREVLGRFSGIDEVVVVPDDRDACDGAMLAGRSLVEHAPTSRARVAIGELARRVLPDRMPRPASRRSLRRGA
jgi:Flp pilus assembly CpaE family ATPase